MAYTGEMVLPRGAVAMTQDEMMYLEGGGFVGFHVKLSANSRKWTASTIAAMITAYYGAYASPLLSTPMGAALWAGVGCVIAAVAYNAANSLLKSALGTYRQIGVNIAGCSWNKYITI
jgi:hypothetical protein